ncbi:STAS domain-containing protein [Nocardia anaemiae]|uniref:STAS domain-containing protein n=1 Tax=Nocardia anaemiae TaxID=263910 RepID=UPI0007A51977|nr:STAS domain-containing protein [Nocardia anaemiae]
MSAVLQHRSNGQHPAGERPRNRFWAQRVDRRKQCVVVRAEGELDAAALPEFRAMLEYAVTTRCHAVVLDLRATKFLSIRVAAAIGAITQRAAHGGPAVRIVAGRREIERVLAVTGVRAVCSDFPTMRAALDT